MQRRAAILCALLSCGVAGCQGKPVAETKIPQEEVDRKNPVESSLSSVAEGKQIYGSTDCALCHGKDGDGKGVEAKDISMNTHDWRKPESLAKFTDGELSYLILKGKVRMPAYDGRETPDQVWKMVVYIRSLSAGGGAPKSWPASFRRARRANVTRTTDVGSTRSGLPACREAGTCLP